jgi:hypothetical protein
MSNTGRAVSSAVDRFLSTYFAVSEKNAREEDRAEESKYREFYAKLQGDANARAEASHEQDMEAGRLQLEAVRRDAEANEAVLSKYGQSLETLQAMSHAELVQFAVPLQEVALESAKLQKQTAEFMLEQYYPAQLGQIKASTARTNALAAGGGGGGRGGREVDPLDALQGQWDIYNTRQKSIEARLKAYENPLTGETDWARVPPQLVESYEVNSQHMSELEAALSSGQGMMLGLTRFERGAGSSEGEGAPLGAIDAALSEKRGPVLSEEERRVQADEANRRGNVKRRKIVVVGAGGDLVATDDDKIFERVKAAGGEWFDIEEVPRWAIGRPAEQFKRYRAEKEKQGVLGGFRGMGGMVDPRAVGMGGL